MARRARTLTTCAAATVAATLTLSACGGGGDASSSDKIKGAKKGGGSSASPSPTSGPKRPEVKLSKHFHMDFRDWTADDPEKQAVLNDGKEEHRATFDAIIANNPNSDALRFYDTKVGFSQSRHWVKSYTKDNVTLVGKLVVFKPKLRVTGHRLATLSFCSNERDGYTKDRKTGKKERTPKDEAHIHYLMRLQKSSQGVWKTDNVRSSDGCSQ